MRDLNVAFFDLYKIVDKHIKYYFSFPDGVSDYIRSMEYSSDFGNSYIRGWKDDYYKLKKARYIRTQLAHEISFDSNICKEANYDWLVNFYNRLLEANDPISLLNGINNPVQQTITTPPDYVIPKLVKTDHTQPATIPDTAQNNCAQKEPKENDLSGCLFVFLILFMIAVAFLIVIAALFILN